MLSGRIEIKVTSNIDDLNYLRKSFDLNKIAVALRLGDKGVRMIMEIVTNNPCHPIKGGGCFYDQKLMRNVIIESFQLKGISSDKINYLNKNINYYPYPYITLATILQRGFSMPISVKHGRLYFQPVQGDLNFLLPTVYIQQANLESICAWKTNDDTPAALVAMFEQDIRPGFYSWAFSLMSNNFKI